MINHDATIAGKRSHEILGLLPPVVRLIPVQFMQAWAVKIVHALQLGGVRRPGMDVLADAAVWSEQLWPYKIGWVIRSNASAQRQKGTVVIIRIKRCKQANLPSRVDTADASRLFSRLAQCRQQHGCKNGNDCNHYKQLN